MRISDSIKLGIAGASLFLGCHAAAWAQDAVSGRGLVPPRPIPGVALPEPETLAPGPQPLAGAPRTGMPAPDQPAAHTALPLVPFTSARDALRAWMRDSIAGDQAGAVRALEYAAAQGHLTAQFKLGRMYAEGEGVRVSELKAFEYFSKIADENPDAIPGTADGRLVGSAFVALGSYFLEGIEGTYVKANADRAFDMFHYSASYFGDPDGQYNLARLYMTGRGVARDQRQAARWMKLAAEKGHVPARAVFGDMLIRGSDGFPRRTAQGLMWLALARQACDPVREAWIIERYETAFAAAAPGDRTAALALVERQQIAGARAAPQRP